MKIIAFALFTASCAYSVSAFSAVAPSSSGSVTGSGSSDEIDRSLRGIDDEASFDPTAGENPALKRNNNDQVWVPQVRNEFLLKKRTSY